MQLHCEKSTVSKMFFFQTHSNTLLRLRMSFFLIKPSYSYMSICYIFRIIIYNLFSIIDKLSSSHIIFRYQFQYDDQLSELD